MGAQQAKHTAEEVWAERMTYLTMPREERVRHYFCGQQTFTKERLLRWDQYFTETLLTPGYEGRQTYQYDVNEEINRKVALWYGDITCLEIDCIVSSLGNLGSVSTSANSVNSAVSMRAGEFYKDECILKGAPGRGQTKLIGGYKLPARYIATTYVTSRPDDAILASCYSNSLEALKGHGLTTIAFPCIGARKLLGFTSKRCAHVALASVRNWIEENKNDADLVIFCVYTSDHQKLYEELMQIYFPVMTPSSVSSRRLSGATASSPEELQAGRLEGVILANQLLRLLTDARRRNEEEADSDLSDPETADSLAARGSTLESWRDQTNTDPFQMQPVVLDRADLDDSQILKKIHTLYNDSRLDLRKKPIVQFKDEEGLDFGALTKEFFHQALDRLTHGQFGQSPAFEGEAGYRLPCASKVHLRNCAYGLTGKVLAHSVLHGGAGVAGLSPSLVFLLTHRLTKDEVEFSGISLDRRDISDEDIIDLLNTADHYDSLSSSEKQTFHGQMVNALGGCGFGYTAINKETLQTLLQEIVIHEVVYKRWEEIEQLRRGLDILGLYSFLCDNPTSENTREVFPRLEDIKIHPFQIRHKLRPDCRDSKQLGFFNKLLDDIYSGELEDATLETLVKFWTGQPTLSEGFLDLTLSPDSVYPVANCCFSKLELPGKQDNYESFRKSFQEALIIGCDGFHRA